MLDTDYLKTTEHEHNTWVEGDKWRNHAGIEMKGLLRLPSEKGNVLNVGKQSHSSQSIEKIML